MKKIIVAIICVAVLALIYWMADRRFNQVAQERLQTWLQENQFTDNVQWDSLTTELWPQSLTLTNVQFEIDRGPLKGLKTQAQAIRLSDWHNNDNQGALTLAINQWRVLHSSSHETLLISRSSLEEWAFHTGLRELPPMNLKLRADYQVKANTFDYFMSLTLPALTQVTLNASLSQVPDLTLLHSPSAVLNLFDGLPDSTQQQFLESTLDSLTLGVRDLGAAQRTLALQERYQWHYSPANEGTYDEQKAQWLQSINAQHIRDCYLIVGPQHSDVCVALQPAIENLAHGATLTVQSSEKEPALKLNDVWLLAKGQQMLPVFLERARLSAESL